MQDCQQVHDLTWLIALRDGFAHQPYLCNVQQDSRTVGLLPLCFVRSAIFGRFLVSLPYLNSAGVVATSDDVARSLIDRAVQLADELDVRYLELRHEQPVEHPALQHQSTSKVHMRLALSASADELWSRLDPKVRNQIRKGQKQELTVHWGASELLGEFYDVFSRNMRDLGTPTFGRKLFRSMHRHFADALEFCVVRQGRRPVASAVLIHGRGTTQVPSASSLRKYNSTNANMLMYWHLLQRSIERGQHTFDFGRSSPDSNTYRFKKQWGAAPTPAVWQYYLRRGSIDDMRPTSPRYRRVIQTWQRLPLWLTRLVGPIIVRGIP
ncbi:MAG: FemAB family PEP-CTERM system-associated protein [Pirellulales bacterium]|nr:FemAB family PEP-CTERM system-associated protein [Pirellulales bacterium]